MPKLRYVGDIVVTDALPYKAATTALIELAEILTATGRGSTHGVYVHKWGKGWAVALHDRYAVVKAAAAQLD